MICISREISVKSNIFKKKWLVDFKSAINADNARPKYWLNSQNVFFVFQLLILLVNGRRSLMTFWRVHASFEGHIRMKVYIRYYYICKIRARYKQLWEKKVKRTEMAEAWIATKKRKIPRRWAVMCMIIRFKRLNAQRPFKAIDCRKNGCPGKREKKKLVPLEWKNMY